MIKEDYVSFETAKLLKEKGFDGNSFFVYELNEKGKYCLERLYDDDFFEEKTMIFAPSQQMAMRWLREVHNLSIVVDCYNDSTDYEEHGQDIEYYINYHWKVVPFIGMSHSTGDVFATYEEALEDALKYTLENLI